MSKTINVWEVLGKVSTQKVGTSEMINPEDDKTIFVKVISKFGTEFHVTNEKVIMRPKGNAEFIDVYLTFMYKYIDLNIYL